METKVVTNKQVILKDYVTGTVKEDDMYMMSSHFSLELKEESQDVLVKNLYLSCDPVMRIRMTNNASFHVVPFTPGSVLDGYGVAKVILSNNPDFKEGDVVSGTIGWEEYSIIHAGRTLHKIKYTDVPLSYYLGPLGIPGLTAYVGFYELSSPKAGETIFISGASGAVGVFVGQFAKLHGCYVVGSAGNAQKVELLKTNFGFDDAFNYKDETDLSTALKRNSAVMETKEVVNNQVIFKDYVTGMVKEDDMFLKSTKLSLEVKGGSQDVLVKTLYISCDPYMRVKMTHNALVNIVPFTPGSVLYGYGVAKVVLSNNPNFKEGDVVSGTVGWEEYSVIHDGHTLNKIEHTDVPLSYYLGPLGIPGLTAYAGLSELSSPKAGETIFVSGASGAVGVLAGQFAKLHGCYVVGSAGSAQKVELLRSRFGFDDTFNYKDETDLSAALKRCCPKGIDIYFENVGGDMLEAVLENMNNFGRITVSGMISQYNLKERRGIKNLLYIITKRIKMHGLIAEDFKDLYPRFREEVAGWIKEGKISYMEDIAEGLEKAPVSLVGLFYGRNLGKQIVKVANEQA